MKQIKYVILLLCFIAQGIVFAQTKEIKGMVVDKQTHRGIDGVVVSDLNNTSTVVTNAEGAFSIVVDHTDELLQFNHIGYQSIQENIANAARVELLPITNELEEILIFNKPLADVFGVALRNIKSAVQSGDLYETYFREFNTVNNDKVNVADGLVDFYVPIQGKQALVEIKENRVFVSKSDIDEDDFAEYLNVMGIGDLRDVLTNIVTEDKIRGIFERDKDYEYTSKLQNRADGTSVIVVAFEPSSTLKKIKKKELYLQGYVVFNEEKTKVLEYKIQLADMLKAQPVTLSFLGLAKLTVRDIEARVLFSDRFASDAVSYSQMYFDFDLMIRLIKRGKANVKVNRELVVDRLTRNVEIPKQKSFKGSSLFAKETSYTTAYWKERNLRPLTKKELRILEELEQKQK